MYCKLFTAIQPHNGTYAPFPVNTSDSLFRISYKIHLNDSRFIWQRIANCKYQTCIFRILGLAILKHIHNNVMRQHGYHDAIAYLRMQYVFSCKYFLIQCNFQLRLQSKSTRIYACNRYEDIYTLEFCNTKIFVSSADLWKLLACDWLSIVSI